MNDLETVRLPKNGQQIEVKFPPGELIGTLTIDNEEIKVYLGNMKAEQLGCIPKRYLGKPVKSPGCIKRIFTFIEC